VVGGAELVGVERPRRAGLEAGGHVEPGAQVELEARAVAGARVKARAGAERRAAAVKPGARGGVGELVEAADGLGGKLVGEGGGAVEVLERVGGPRPAQRAHVVALHALLHALQLGHVRAGPPGVEPAKAAQARAGQGPRGAGLRVPGPQGDPAPAAGEAVQAGVLHHPGEAGGGRPARRRHLPRRRVLLQHHGLVARVLRVAPGAHPRRPGPVFPLRLAGPHGVAPRPPALVGPTDAQP
jgi:hypothetical protein